MNGVIITTSENHIMECIIYYTFFFANQVVHRIIILVIHQGLFLHLSVMGMEIGDLAIVSSSIRLIVMSLISFEFMCSVHFTSESFARTVAAIRILGSPIINHGVYFLHDDLVVVLPAMDSFRIIIIIIITIIIIIISVVGSISRRTPLENAQTTTQDPLTPRSGTLLVILIVAGGSSSSIIIRRCGRFGIFFHAGMGMVDSMAVVFVIANTTTGAASIVTSIQILDRLVCLGHRAFGSFEKNAGGRRRRRRRRRRRMVVGRRRRFRTSDRRRRGGRERRSSASIPFPPHGGFLEEEIMGRVVGRMTRSRGDVVVVVVAVVVVVVVVGAAVDLFLGNRDFIGIEIGLRFSSSFSSSSSSSSSPR
mmetsp:Transcript_20377/g.41770  ORF Transcript_20377/g.41770 Transcript_20377/m.41770 type:complete len:364 (+) Transcript_20377:1004-2095(+)